MEDPGKIAGWLRAEWEAISSAPFSFLAAVLVLVSLGLGLGWAGFRWYYGKQTADKDAAIQHKDSLIKLLQERLKEREGEISALEALIKKLSARRIKK